MKEDDNQGKRREMALEISPTVEGGVYSNIANIIHSKNEFIIDFAIVLPGKNAAKIQSRIITNPIHAKQLLTALNENVVKYEKMHGEIVLEPQPPFSQSDSSLH